MRFMIQWPRMSPEDTFNDSFESSGDESIYDKADLGLGH